MENNFDEALKEAQTIDNRLKFLRELHEKDPTVEIEREEDRLLWQSPLVGVPVSIKESIAVKGMKSTAGLAYRKDSRASSDSVAVDNIRKLGLIPVVTTNVPELTMYWADCRVSYLFQLWLQADLSKLEAPCYQYFLHSLTLFYVTRHVKKVFLFSKKSFSNLPVSIFVQSNFLIHYVMIINHQLIVSNYYPIYCISK